MNTRFRKLTLGMTALTLLSGFRLNLNAATLYSSTGSGDWSNPASWTISGTGGLPLDYIINTGHTITMDMDVWDVENLTINGTMKVGINKSLYMNKTGSILVNATGSIKSGTAKSGIWFDTACTIYIKGAFMGKDLIDGGPRMANYWTMIWAGGDPQGSFPVILPVDLKTMEVALFGTDYYLSFVALGESNQNDFRVELSTNGTDFTDAGVIEGNRELSEGAYEFNLGIQEQSFYVRLSEITNSGTDILAVKHVRIAASSDGDFKMFPTLIEPSIESLNLVLPAAGSYKVQFFNTAMQEISAQSLTTATDDELQSLNLNRLLFRPGTYFTIVTGDNGQIYKSKILVQ